MLNPPQFKPKIKQKRKSVIDCKNFDQRNLTTSSPLKKRQLIVKGKQAGANFQ